MRLNINGGARWVTAPIVRNYHGTRPVGNVEFDESAQWREKLSKTLESAYGRAPHFAEAMALARPLIVNPERRIAAYNLEVIRSVARSVLPRMPRIVLASELSAAGSATELLIALVRAVDGDTYLSGGGADSYQEPGQFEQAGIRFVYQDFQHPVYLQQGRAEFVPGLSVLDALMNLGVDGTRRILAGQIA